MRHQSRTALFLAVRFVLVLALAILVAEFETKPAHAQTPPPSETKAVPSTIHVVRAGESLWSIAALRLGSSRLWPSVYRANRDQIMDPARLFIGQRLSIPQLSEEEKKAVLSSPTLPQTLKPVLATPASTEAQPASASATPPSATHPAAIAPSAAGVDPAVSPLPALQSPSVQPAEKSAPAAPATAAEPKHETSSPSAPIVAP